jgi:hypothetical protein
METSKHIELKHTVNVEWESSTQKIVDKKPKAVEAVADLPDSSFDVVRLTPDFGVAGNHKKPTAELLKKPTIDDASAFAPYTEPMIVEPVTATSTTACVTVEDCIEEGRMPNIMMPDAPITFVSDASVTSISCSDKGQVVVMHNNQAPEKEKMMIRPVKPQSMTDLYAVNYMRSGVDSFRQQMGDFNLSTNTRVSVAALEHLAQLANSAEYIPNIQTSVLEGEPVINDVVIPRTVMESFLREASPKEPKCVKGPACIAMRLHIPEPFVLVAFYILERANERNLSHLDFDTAEELRESKEPQHRDKNNIVSSEPARCILDILHDAATIVNIKTADRSTASVSKRKIHSPISMSVSANGEFRTQDCLSPGYSAYNGLMGHIPLVNANYFRRGEPKVIDGTEVQTLLFAKPCFKRLSDTVRF